MDVSRAGESVALSYEDLSKRLISNTSCIWKIEL